MTLEDLQLVIDTLKKEGRTEDEIVRGFTGMYLDDKLNFEQYNALLHFMKYTLNEDLLNASEGARKVILREMFKSK